MGTREVGRCSEPDALRLQPPTIVAVHRSPRHGFSKQPQEGIRLIARMGVEGDAHAGSTVQHIYLKKKDPSQANLAQVHLVSAELFEELLARGLRIAPGDIGENVTTHHIDLLRLPLGTHLHLGATAVVEVTGLRTPCVKMNRFLPGLMAATLDREPAGNLVRKAGIMSIVIASGTVRSGDTIGVVYPPGPHRELDPV